jgi:hypothetical protein
LSVSASKSRRQFIKYGVVVAAGVGVASAIEIPVFASINGKDNNTVAKQNAQIAQLQTQAIPYQQMQVELTSLQALRTLGMKETLEVKAIIQAMAPSGNNGSSAVQAAVLSFVDDQLSGVYGLIVKGISFSSNAVPPSITTYQYAIVMRELWRTGLSALESYSNRAYGKSFKDLSVDQRKQALSDLSNNKPTDFGGVVPNDFYSQLVYLINAGFSTVII